MSQRCFHNPLRVKKRKMTRLAYVTGQSIIPEYTTVSLSHRVYSKRQCSEWVQCGNNDFSTFYKFPPLKSLFFISREVLRNTQAALLKMIWMYSVTVDGMNPLVGVGIKSEHPKPILSCADTKCRCLKTSELQIHLHPLLEGNMPEISKDCPVSNTWFDQNTDESKVIADRDALVFWWRRVVFYPMFTVKSSLPTHEGWFFPSASCCRALSSFLNYMVPSGTWGKCHFP